MITAIQHCICVWGITVILLDIGRFGGGSSCGNELVEGVATVVALEVAVAVAVIIVAVVVVWWRR